MQTPLATSASSCFAKILCALPGVSEDPISIDLRGTTALSTLGATIQGLPLYTIKGYYDGLSFFMLAFA